MRSAPSLLLLSAALLLITGCDCGRGRLVAAQGGSIKVILVGAPADAVELHIGLRDVEGQLTESSLRITTLPLSTQFDQLLPGTWRATVTARDSQQVDLQAMEVPRIVVVIGGVTEITVDLSRLVVTPAEQCNGVDDDRDGEVDEALDLPVCVACRSGQATVVTDDARCGAIACDSLDTFELRGDNTPAAPSTCVKLEHAPLTTDRCVGEGACAAPGGPACDEAAERVLMRTDLCQTMQGCEAGAPTVLRAADGSPCGVARVCLGGACVPVMVDAGTANPAGCSDGTREGFLSVSGYPDIAACSGGWSVPGVTQTPAPACARVSGNTSSNPEGNGCAAMDLCAAGWHVCRGKDEVSQKANGSCADAVPPGAQNNSLFFAVSQASQSNTACDGTGDNDVFGCGNLGTPLSPAKNCGVLTRALASTHPGTCGFNEAEPNLGPWQCLGGTQGDLHEGGLVTKKGCPNTSCSYSGAPVGNADKGGVLCCRD